MEKLSLGSKLLALKERSGLSLANIAKAAGYRQPSSIQRYFSEDYDAEHLPPSLAKRLELALVGFGSPPIEAADIFRLEKYGFYLDRKFQPASAQPVRIERRRTDYIEVHASFPIGIYESEADVFSIILDPLLYFAKPKHLSQRRIEGVMLAIDCMKPKYDPGTVVFWDSEFPASDGQDVLVLRSMSLSAEGGEVDLTPDGQVGDAILATLVRRTRDEYHFKVHNPPCEFAMPRNRVDAVYPLLRTEDFLLQRSEDEIYAQH